MARCGASDCGVAERDVNAPILRSEGSGRHQQDALLPCPTPPCRRMATGLAS